MSKIHKITQHNKSETEVRVLAERQCARERAKEEEEEGRRYHVGETRGGKKERGEEESMAA